MRVNVIVFRVWMIIALILLNLYYSPKLLSQEDLVCPNVSKYHPETRYEVLIRSYADAEISGVFDIDSCDRRCAKYIDTFEKVLLVRKDRQWIPLESIRLPEECTLDVWVINGEFDRAKVINCTSHDIHEAALNEVESWRYKRHIEAGLLTSNFRRRQTVKFKPFYENHKRK